MKPTNRHRVAALAIAFGVLACATAFADPPGRVARLNYLKGSVSFRPASLDDWAPATLNYPLTAGDHLWTEPSAWAEMHVGSTAIRLAPSTAFAFLNLDDQTTQVRLSEGAVDVRVRNLDGSEEFEIDTPSAAVVLSRPGVYRVDVLPDGGSTRVTVRYGMASVSADGPEFYVRDGETAAIYGTESVSHEIFRAAAPDNWERWCRTRDEREDRAASLRHVSYEMTGYEDLDEYGAWSNVPDYGWGWQPRVAYGWSPYRYGQWRWISPWGWTWIDDASWGFAPFHYGRWSCLRGSWYWFPGSYVLRPVYAPALVAFIGGDHWGLSVGFGRSHVGWFPLAPGELWMPYYRASHTYIRNLNITNVHVTNININNYDASRGTYVNRAIAGAVTAVPRDSFMRGRAVARDAVAVDSRAVMRAQVVGGSAPIAPTVEAVAGRRGGYVARPPSTALDRAVVARSQPASAPVPFAAQERAIQANGGRPLDDAAMAQLRNQSGDRGFTAPVRMAGARGGSRGQPGRGGADRGGADRVDRPRGEQPGAGGFGAGGAGLGGVATRRGERSTDAARPENPAQPMGGGARPEGNDRPSWARPRGGADTAPSNPRYGGDAAPANPRYGGDDRGGVRGRPGDSIENRPSGGGASGLPARGGEARPRGGDRGTPSGNDRPTFGRPGSDTPRPSGGDTSRPSGGDNSRPSGGDNSRPAGARQRGGEPAQAAPSSRPPDNTARPRSGGRGGDSAYYESSSRPFANDRPAYGSRSTYGNDRPSPQYRSVPEYRSMPESRPSPQYRSVPEYRPMPESRPTPQYRSVPEYRSMPESRPTPQYQPRGGDTRSYGGGGAVERRGGGGAPSAAPAPRSQGGDGQAVPRGGARNRGRGE